MIYVDDIFDYEPMLHAQKNPMARQASRWGTRWCHLWADSETDIPELHRIAVAIGLKAAYFQNRRGFPHYDLIPRKRALALKHGAVAKPLKEWIRERNATK